LEEQERNHGPRKLISAISLYDLGQRKPSPEELVGMAKRFNYEAGAAFLARLNVCLSLAMASSDDKVVVEAHKKLTSNVLSPSRLQEIVSAVGDKLYQSAILLNRAQLLSGIKLLALYAQREGGFTLETEVERHQVGELALAINSFYGPDVGEPNWPAGDVSVQLTASAELNNPEPILNGLVLT